MEADLASEICAFTQAHNREHACGRTCGARYRREAGTHACTPAQCTRPRTRPNTGTCTNCSDTDTCKHARRRACTGTGKHTHARTRARVRAANLADAFLLDLRVEAAAAVPVRPVALSHARTHGSTPAAFSLPHSRAVSRMRGALPETRTCTHTRKRAHAHARVRTHAHACAHTRTRADANTECRSQRCLNPSHGALGVRVLSLAHARAHARARARPVGRTARAPRIRALDHSLRLHAAGGCGAANANSAAWYAPRMNGTAGGSKRCPP